MNPRSKSGSSLSSIFSRPWSGIALFLIVIFIVMSFASPAFLTQMNLLNILSQSTFLMILAAGMAIVLIGGGIDLSVGAIAGIAGGVVAWLIAETGMTLFPAAMIGLVVALLFGGLNALIITGLRIPDFIATLAMMGFVRGLLHVWTEGVPFTRYWSKEYGTVGGLFRLFSWVTVPEIIAFVIILILILVLVFTKFGRHLRASGENPDVALLSGVNVLRVKITIYLISGLLAGVVGVMLGGKLMTVQANMGMGLEISALAAAIMGGAALTGGRGSIVGAMLGAVALTVIQNAINLLGIEPSWEPFVVGIIILAVVLISKTSTMVSSARRGS
jgi:ribose transport system permease protein